MADKPRELAKGMVLSVYPSERAALLRIAREQNMKSPFDVVRTLALSSQLVKPEDFRAPKQRT